VNVKVFLSTVMAGLAIAALFVYWIDPAGQWHHQIQFPRHSLNRGEVWVIPKMNFDDRALRFSQINYIDCPEIVFFGSSRVLPVYTGYFKPGTRIFNAGVVGPLVYDFLAIWQALKEAHKLPVQMVIFADPWVINGNAALFYHWSINRYVRHFLQSISGTTNPSFDWTDLSNEAWMFLNNCYHKSTELLTWKEVRYALEYLKRYGFHQPIPYIASENSILRGSSAYRWDGSLCNWDNNSTLDDVRQDAISEVDRKDGLSLTNWRLDNDLVILLHNLCADAQKNHVLVTFVLPPYHPVTYRLYNDRANYKRALEQYRYTFDELEKFHTNVTVCDVVDPVSADCSESEFNDWIHMRQSCIQKVLRKCIRNKG
jgi:hypothetical protein